MDPPSPVELIETNPSEGLTVKVGLFAQIGIFVVEYAIERG